MSKWKWNLLAVFFTGVFVLGGAWFWDASDYPMPGIPKAPPVPFAYDNWDWSESVVTNLSRLQSRLQDDRYRRFKEKWIRELKLEDTYWTFRSGKFAVHFGSDGSFRVRKPVGQRPDELEDFHSFQHSQVKEILLFRGDEIDSIRVRISAINENSIMLVAPDNSPMAVIDRKTSSKYFDSLAN